MLSGASMPNSRWKIRNISSLVQFSEILACSVLSDSSCICTHDMLLLKADFEKAVEIKRKLTVKKLYPTGRLSKLVKVGEQLHLNNNIYFTTYAMHRVIYRYPSSHN